MYHNKQELIEKRDIAEKKKEEVGKLEKIKETSDEEIKAKKKELAIYNKQLATDEQKIKELVRSLSPRNNQTIILHPFRKHKSTRIARSISKPKRTRLIIRRNSILPSKKSSVLTEVTFSCQENTSCRGEDACCSWRRDRQIPEGPPRSRTIPTRVRREITGRISNRRS